MGKLYSMISALLIAVASVFAGTPTGYVWWLDNDITNTTSGSLSDGSAALQIDMSRLEQGVHYFNCRLTDADGEWGSVYRRMILTADASEAINITGFECWLDDLYADRKTGTISPGDNSYSVDVRILPSGFHRLNYRFSDDHGNWGSVHSYCFYIDPPDPGPGVRTYEYWIDDNYAARISGNLSADANSFGVDMSGAAPGLHHFNCRISDSVKGSSVHSYCFYIPTPEEQRGVRTYEYWIDDNYTARVSGNLSADANSFGVDMSGAAPGLHHFNCRISDSVKGSSVHTYCFYIPTPEEQRGELTYEYWIDSNYGGRKSIANPDNPVSFDIDLSNIEDNGRPHFFNLKVSEGTTGRTSFYRKLIVSFHNQVHASSVEEYRHYANNIPLGTVAVNQGIGESFSFIVDLPDELWSVSNKKLVFDDETVSIVDANTLYYAMQVHTDVGWAPPMDWRFDVEDGDFSTTIVEMSVNSKRTFDTPALGRFVAVKFTTGDEGLYYSSDIPISFDIYRDGEKVAEITASELAGIASKELSAGEYIGILRDVEGSAPDKFTFSIMDSPEGIPAPVIEFADGVVSMSCDREGAEIRYTLDGTEPTTESERYWEPFRLEHNAVIMARAFVPDTDIDPSEITEYVVDSYRAETPTWEFDASTRLLTLACATEGAAISYTLDLDGEWTVYGEPIRLRHNATVYARAAAEGYNDSEIATIDVTELPESVPTPEISYEDGVVSITCALDEAEIHYTLDGADPTLDSERYDGPFSLDYNTTIKARAFVTDLDIEPSEIATYEIGSFQTAAPTGLFDVATRLLTLACATEGAVISYTFDLNDAWVIYDEPIRLRHNTIVYAMAARTGFSDSETAVIEVTELPESVPMPEIAYNDGVVSIACALEEAEIHYTLDGADPTTDSERYDGPFRLDYNTTIKARAFVTDLDIEPSEIATYEIGSFQTAAPTGMFDVATRLLTLSCATEGAVISYAFDPAGEWTTYQSPIRLRKNCTVYAKAAFDGYNDSEVAVIPVTELPESVPTPEIAYSEGVVTITCALDEAEIRYTLDGADPSTDSERYDGPFSLDYNTTIKAKAFVTDLDIEPSEIATYVVGSFQTAAPTGMFDVATRLLTLSCATEGAVISYAFDPADEWTTYQSPIRLRKNCTVYAKAAFDGYNDSEVTVIPVSELPESVPMPEIAYNNGVVTITCALDEAEIRYTLDGSDPTTESERYDGPFRLDYNTTIKARAFVTDLDIEPSEIATYEIGAYKVATPYGQFDVATRLLTLSCTTEDAVISYTLDLTGEWITYESPVMIDHNCTIFAKAVREGYNPSDIAEITVDEFKCEPVTISYNGRYISMEAGTEDAVIRYSLDGSDPAEGESYSDAFDVHGLCTVRAVAIRDGYDNSEEAVLEIRGYANETHAETAEPGLLGSCYGWADSSMPQTIADLSVEGYLNDADFAFIRSMMNLQNLDISKVKDALVPSSALANMSLVTVSMPAGSAEYGDAIFTGCADLCAIIWNSGDAEIESRVISGSGNPNILLYVRNAALAANAGIANTVVSEYAAHIVLTDGYPFNAPVAFTAGEISYTRHFSKLTQIGGCSGWESIALPFNVQDIRDNAGEIKPFEMVNAGERPFWLYEPDGNGWLPSFGIMAYRPYIISMPNNPDYHEHYNIQGDVVFSARNVTVGVTPDAVGFAYSRGMELWPAFSRQEAERGKLLINDDTFDGYVPGSVFVDGLRDVRPFECYLTSPSGARRVPVFDNSGMEDTMGLLGMKVWTEGHTLCILSGIDRTVRIFDPEGHLVRMVELEGGTVCRITDLLRGFYFVEHEKVLVR